MNKLANNFIWEIGNFQEHVKNISYGNCIISQKFWIPNVPLGKPQNDKSTLWQLILYPNGANGAKFRNCVSLFLKAVQTTYEKSNNINGRYQRYMMGIGKNIIDENKKILIKKAESINYFSFNNSCTWGNKKFVESHSIFPDDNKSQDVDLFVQISFLDDVDSDYDDDDDDVDIIRPVEYFENNSFSDIEFTFECGSRIKAHRLVLALNSEYFKNMLNGGWKEQNMNVIAIKETTYKTFRAILHFIYTGELLDLDGFDDLYELLKQSDMMTLGCLKNLILKRMTNFINEDNWDTFLLLGSKYDLLKITGLEYAADNWEVVKKSEGMQRFYENNGIDGMEELILFGNKRKEIVNWDNDSLFGRINEN